MRCCWIVLILIFNITAWAESNNDLIVIAGNANTIRFARISEMWVNAFKGSDIQIYANPKTKDKEAEHSTEELKERWDQFKSLGQFTLLEEKGDLLGKLGKGRAQSKANNVVIFINDHGNSPRIYSESKIKVRRTAEGNIAELEKKTDTDKWVELDSKIDVNNFLSKYDPETTGISLESGNIKVSEFNQALRENFKGSEILRLIGVQCFSGGMHEISFQNENTCSLSSTDWVSPTISTDEINKYGQGIAEEKSAKKSKKKFDLDNNGETNLIEAHFAGLLKDNLNYGRSQLSSMAYVEKVLKVGAYSVEEIEEVHDLSSGIMADSLSCVSRAEQLQRTNQSAQGFLPLLKYLKSDPQYQINVDAMSLENQTPITLSSMEYQKLPLYLQDIYSKLRNHSGVKKSLKDFVKNSRRYLTKLNELKEKRIKILPFENENPNALTFKDRKKLNKIDEDIRKTKLELKQSQAQWRGFYKYMLHLKRVAEFMSVASEADKQKFMNLLECERFAI